MERKILTSPCEAWVGGDSFVQVMDVSIGGTRSDMSLEVHVMNLHTFQLKGIEFEANFFDSANNLLNKEPQKIKSEEISIDTGKIGRACRYLLKELSAARKAQIRLLKGYYSDGNTLDLIYEKMEKVVFNPLDANEKEILKKALGEDAYILAKGETSSWRCVCGYFNGYNSENCSNCGRSQELVLQKYADFTSILGVLEEAENISEESQKEEAAAAPPEEPKYKTIKQFFSEIPKWIWMLLFISGVLISSSFFIRLANLKK